MVMRRHWSVLRTAGGTTNMRRYTFVIAVVMSTVLAAACVAGVECGNELYSAALNVTSGLKAIGTPAAGAVNSVNTIMTPAQLGVDLGSSAGIEPGQLLSLLSNGKTLQAGGPGVACQQVVVGTAKVTAVVNSILSAAEVQDSAAVEIGNIATAKAIPRWLEIGEFVRPDGTVTVLGDEFANALRRALMASGRFEVVGPKWREVTFHMGTPPSGLASDTRRQVQELDRPDPYGVISGVIAQHEDKFCIAAVINDGRTGKIMATIAADVVSSEELGKKYATIAGADERGYGRIIVPSQGADTAMLFRDIRPVKHAYNRALLYDDENVGGRVYDAATLLRWDIPDHIGVYTEFAINGEWRTASFEVGFEKGQDANAKACVVLLGDMRELDRAEVVAGEIATLKADITGVRHLRVNIEKVERADGCIWFGDCVVGR